jgi:hypothetical protein
MTGGKRPATRASPVSRVVGRHRPWPIGVCNTSPCRATVRGNSPGVRGDARRSQRPAGLRPCGARPRGRPETPAGIVMSAGRYVAELQAAALLALDALGLPPEYLLPGPVALLDDRGPTSARGARERPRLVFAHAGECVRRGDRSGRVGRGARRSPGRRSAARVGWAAEGSPRAGRRERAPDGRGSVTAARRGSTGSGRPPSPRSSARWARR